MTPALHSRKVAFRLLLITGIISSAFMAGAQTSLNTPVYHSDTSQFYWSGSMDKKKREGEWIGAGKIFRDTAYAQYTKGKLNGKYTVRYKDGSVQEEGNYVDNLRDGKWIRYDNKKDTTGIYTYKMGVLEGEYKTFSSGNRITRQGKFVNGKKEGRWDTYEYTTSGLLRSHTIYQYEGNVLNGPVVVHTFSGTTTTWYESGKLVKTETIEKTDSSYVNRPEPGIEDVVLSFAEEMPQYVGGEVAYQEYLQDSLRYPQSVADAGKQGTAWVNFTVEKDGTITNAVLLKGIIGAPELNEEAVRLISAMPRWIPGKMNGRPVKITMTLPVKFVLK